MADPAEEGAKLPFLRQALPVLAILLGLTLSVDTDSFFPVARGAETAADLVRRSVEYRRTLAANDALEAEVRYLGTRQGGKWAVYRYLGLVEPGQQAGRVVEAPPPEPAALTRPQRMRNWIVTTEEYGAQLLQGLWQTLACYADWRPLDLPPAERNPVGGGVSKETEIGGHAGATISPL